MHRFLLCVGIKIVLTRGYEYIAPSPLWNFDKYKNVDHPKTPEKQNNMEWDNKIWKVMHTFCGLLLVTFLAGYPKVQSELKLMIG